MAPTLDENDDIVVIHRWHKMAPVISLRNTNYERLEGGMDQNRQNRFAWKEFEVESNNPATLSFFHHHHHHHHHQHAQPPCEPNQPPPTLYIHTWGKGEELRKVERRGQM